MFAVDINFWRFQNIKTLEALKHIDYNSPFDLNFRYNKIAL